MALIISVWHHKGGVGKSTLAYNLACHLAIAKKRVLAVGLNSQATLERFCGIEAPDKLPIQHTLGYALESMVKGEEAKLPIFDLQAVMAEIKPKLVREVRQYADLISENLYLCPSNYYLNMAEMILVGVEMREFKLVELFQQVQDSFDYIILDCPGEPNLSTTMGLVVSDFVLVPLQTDQTSHDNFELTRTKIRGIQMSANRNLKYAGFVPTMYDGRKGHDREVLEAIQGLSSTAPVHPPLKDSVAFKDSSSANCPLILYDRRHESVKSLNAIAKHVLNLKP